MTDLDIDPVGAGAVLLNTDGYVQNLRDDTTLTTSLENASSAASPVAQVSSAVDSVLSNLAIPARDNVLGLCEGRLRAGQTVIDAYVESMNTMGENATVHQSAVDEAQGHLDRDQYGDVDLSEL